MLLRGRRFLGVGTAEILDWSTLSRVALAAAVACLPALLIVRAPLPPLLRLAAGGTAYAAAYLALRARFLRVITAVGVVE